MKSNLAKLNIFFGELNYQTITQIKAYNFGSLLGDIGGQMGLFIGASILTLLEFGEYFLVILIGTLRDLFSRFKKSPSPPETRFETHEYVDEMTEMRRKLDSYRARLDDYESHKGLVSEL